MSDENTQESNAPESGTPAGAKPVRRRAAARPAGPPTAADGAGDAAAKGKPAAKTSNSKPAAKSAAAKKASSAKAAAPAGEGSAGEGSEKPAGNAKPAKKAASAAADSGDSAADASGAPAAAFLAPVFQAPQATAAPKTRAARLQAKDSDDDAGASRGGEADDAADDGDDESGEGGAGGNRRRRRGSRGRRGKGGAGGQGGNQNDDDSTEDSEDDGADGDSGDDSGDSSAHRRRRRRRAGEGAEGDEPADSSTVVHVRNARAKDEVRGSVRMESKKNRRRDGRENSRRRVNISEAEFLARRESVDRVMVVRDREGITQIGVLEDGILVEHYVTQAGSGSLIGNVYLGRVQNVLPSMEAVFIDIGRGRNGVLYAGEINWDLLGITKSEDRRVENALKSGDTIVVQVSKDPVGQKGARLTHMASIPGRYVVYVPNSTTTGISRKLPDNERNRLKTILRGVLPEDGGVIVRTAAEGASEEELSRDVHRLLAQWEDIKTKSATAKAPALLYSEPDMTIKVVRDIFNEDFKVLKVAGDDSYDTLQQYIGWVAPDLLPRLEKWVEPKDIFTAHRVDEQLAKALDRKVHLPSGGSLVIDRTEAMTVIDVNTGRFIGSGGNLEETVTKNNLEAAEEIVRQLRLRDIGGIIVVDFIDMVLESNRDLVLRRLVECLGRDRTKHQVAEVTSLGLVQMTRKRIGQGLLEVFSQPCDHCNGRGVRITPMPVPVKEDRADADRRPKSEGRDSGQGKSGGGKSGQGKSGQGKSGGGKSGQGTSSQNGGKPGGGKSGAASLAGEDSADVSSAPALAVDLDEPPFEEFSMFGGGDGIPEDLLAATEADGAE